jgi:hypothetical protein
MKEYHELKPSWLQFYLSVTIYFSTGSCEVSNPWVSLMGSIWVRVGVRVSLPVLYLYPQGRVGGLVSAQAPIKYNDQVELYNLLYHTHIYKKQTLSPILNFMTPTDLPSDDGSLGPLLQQSGRKHDLPEQFKGQGVSKKVP